MITNYSTQQFIAFDTEDEADDSSNLPQEYTGTVSGSFTNEDQEPDTSIGSGAADQGMNAEDQDKEDEYGAWNGTSPEAGFNHQAGDDSQPDKSSGLKGIFSGKYETDFSSAADSGTMEKGSQTPDHGLVEEGPGPDA